MIIRIQASGGSFRGAGKYYLHDKLKEGEKIALRDQGDDRVWFTDTRNTLNVDPERALDEMWRTAESQAYLKMQAGVRRGGRVCEDPVKTISLSWHKDDQPTPEHMVTSADAFMKHMGWDQHQAVYVGHNDTEHRHIHIILNRVHWETGRTLDDYREQKRAQVWALSYEKEHENVRCEERELRAAQRERRAPELNDSKMRDVRAEQTEHAKQARTPANDHLPHNVVMLSRPLEQQFNADEQARQRDALSQAAELKAHQRAEREAYFKDGSKLFKAARHAAYDEVRKEFKAEWRQYYKDARQAGFGAADAKDKAVADALYAAYAGDWFQARQYFDGREDQMHAAAQQFAERKADLEARQKVAVAERQRDACDTLRASRDLEYKELLQRQQGERAALSAGATLETLGIGSARSEALNNEPVANQNAAQLSTPAPQQQFAEPGASGAGHAERTGDDKPNDKEHTAQIAAGTSPVAPVPAPSAIEAAQLAIAADALAAADKAVPDERGGSLDTSVLFPTPDVTRLSDAAAIAIGSVASYLADQLGEMFAPTPPEVREANAKAEAKREAETPAPAPKDKANAYARQIEAAMRVIEQERSEQDGRAYWEGRDRGKGFERDQ